MLTAIFSGIFSIAFFVGMFVLYWFIQRSAAFSALKKYEAWKKKQNQES